jgi:hypothetical protein
MASDLGWDYNSGFALAKVTTPYQMVWLYKDRLAIAVHRLNLYYGCCSNVVVTLVPTKLIFVLKHPIVGLTGGLIDLNLMNLPW